MKKSFAIILSGLLVIGAAGTIMAGSGGKCGQKSHAAAQINGTAQALPAATTATPAEAMAGNPACSGCPEAQKAAMEKAGCCPGKIEGAAKSADKAVDAKLTAEKAAMKADCEAKANPGCDSKANGASIAPQTPETGKKAS